jgi:chromosome segregation ATPase
MTEELKSINTTISTYEAHIAAETAKLQEDKQAQREERERKIQAAKAEVSSLEASIKENIEQTRERDAQRLQLKQDCEKTQRELDEARQRITDCGMQCRNLENQIANRLEAYGSHLPNVLERLRRERWHGEVPIGPLGEYVNLREKRWQQLIRAQLGGFMFSFVITDARDRALLRKILNDSQKYVTFEFSYFPTWFDISVCKCSPHMQIIVSQRDLFDYHHGEPPSNYLTVLRALNVSYGSLHS